MKWSEVLSKLYMVIFVIVLDKRICNRLLLIVANLQNSIFCTWICVKFRRKIETLFFCFIQIFREKQFVWNEKSYANGFGNVKKKNLKKKNDFLKDKFEVYQGLRTDQTSSENLPLYNFMGKHRTKWALMLQKQFIFPFFFFFFFMAWKNYWFFSFNSQSRAKW